MSWENILNNRQIAADTEEKVANQGEVLRGGISRIAFPYRKNINHATESSAVGYVISKQHWKSTSNITKTINNYGLN